MPNFLEEQQQEQKIMSERVPMTARRIATLVVLLLAFVGQAVGAVQFGWDMEDISGLYIIVAVVVAIINGINPSKVCVDFIKGTTTVISAVIVIGVARAIYLLMEQAQMVDVYKRQPSRPWRCCVPSTTPASCWPAGPWIWATQTGCSSSPFPNRGNGA